MQEKKTVHQIKENLRLFAWLGLGIGRKWSEHVTWVSVSSSVAKRYNMCISRYTTYISRLVRRFKHFVGFDLNTHTKRQSSRVAFAFHFHPDLLSSLESKSQKKGSLVWLGCVCVCVCRSLSLCVYVFQRMKHRKRYKVTKKVQPNGMYII